MKNEKLNIKQAALVLGVHRDTIVYWEENKLIPAAERNPDNNYRVYSLDALKEIAKSRGMFSLDIDSRLRKLKAGQLNAS